jgi:hypothetical protein
MEINLSGKVKNIVAGLDPKCDINRTKRTPEVLSATGYLKPCCYYSTSEAFEELVEYYKPQGINAESDLNINKHSIPEIKQTATWKAIEEGIYTGNIPKVCFRKCSSDESLPTTIEAKNWEVFDAKG